MPDNGASVACPFCGGPVLTAVFLHPSPRACADAACAGAHGWTWSPDGRPIRKAVSGSTDVPKPPR